MMLTDKIALVTGGTAGIGKAIALKFAEHGAFVIIFGTNAERGQEVVDELKGKGIFYKVNVQSKEEVDLAVKKILENQKTIDILVNNAGITKDQLLIKMTESDWDEVMDINVKSCYNLTQACVRTMMKQRSGRIINMTSVVGIKGNAGQANYAASKAAIIGFTKSMADELAKRNINVNAIAPGFIETRMTDEMTEAQKEMTLAQIPFGRMGKPDDIANAALFLATHLSDYVTGQVLTVDGGMVM
jgi:3-oxoacyl-[acyl-carrier protein] reductase